MVRRASGGCAAWLVVSGGENAAPLLLGEDGPLIPDSAAGLLPVEIPAGRTAASGLSPALHNLARKNGLAVLGAMGLPGQKKIEGLLLILDGEPRAPSEEEWEMLEDIAGQAALVLKSDQLTSELAVARAAENAAREALADRRDGAGSVTEMEADLRRLETWFQSVWANSRDAMRLIDQNGLVVEVNEAYCRLVEKPREDLLEKPFVVAYGYAEPEVKVREFRERFAQRIIPPRLELEIPLWNGVTRVFDLASSFFEVDEQPLLLTSYRDVTDRKQREAELKKLNEALRQRASHLGALTLQLTRVEQQERRRLAQTVHDHLQQLLVAARMTMERVLLRIPKGDVADTAAEVEYLIDESIAASRSITMELSPPVLHDGGLIAALEWLGRRVKEKQNLRVNLTADPAAEPSSEVLRLFLFQAVRELLFNCYKHAGVDEVAVSVELSDQKVRVVVKDEGAGFDQAAYRLGETSSRDCFGLFSLGERIDHLGGVMEIEAAPGRGTCVRMVVPMRPAVAVPSAEEPILVPHYAAPPGFARPVERQERGAGENIRLLLVDDHMIMRQGLRELLRGQPDMVVVGEAANGLEGLKLAQELQPDVVVMDISMPLMNGIEATRILSAELPEILVIVLSMHVKEDMAKAILEAGAAAYVTKVTASETLVATIRERLHAGRRPARIEEPVGREE